MLVPERPQSLILRTICLNLRDFRLKTFGVRCRRGFMRPDGSRFSLRDKLFMRTAVWVTASALQIGVLVQLFVVGSQIAATVLLRSAPALGPPLTSSSRSVLGAGFRIIHIRADHYPVPYPENPSGGHSTSSNCSLVAISAPFRLSPVTLTGLAERICATIQIDDSVMVDDC
jgi:hypothetical protein